MDGYQRGSRLSVTFFSPLKRDIEAKIFIHNNNSNPNLTLEYKFFFYYERYTSSNMRNKRTRKHETIEAIKLNNRLIFEQKRGLISHYSRCFTEFEIPL